MHPRRPVECPNLSAYDKPRPQLRLVADSTR